MAPPRPRTHWCPVILATSSNIGGVATSSVVTWYGGDLVAKEYKTYCVRQAGRCRGMSSASYGLAQNLQRTTVTRGLAAGPDMFEGRSRYSNLSPRGRPSGWLCAGKEPTVMILKGPVQLRESFSLRTLSSAPLRSPCRVVAAVLYSHTQPPATYLGRPRGTSERVELRPLMRATVRACCSRTSS